MRIDTLNYLPNFILNNPDVNELLVSEQIELDRFFELVEIMRLQTNINTASIYLSRYERIFGLEVNTSLSDEERISRILAKMNTHTNSTVEAIKTVVSSFTKSETDIDEIYNEYRFKVNINRDNLQLINLEDIKSAISIIKPAHLLFSIVVCWKWSIALRVESVVYKVAYDVCGNVGGDYDYTGETPDLSYLGLIDDIVINTSSDEILKAYPYSFTGKYPNISTLGNGHYEKNVINTQVENYTAPYSYVRENDDYCGE